MASKSNVTAMPTKTEEPLAGMEATRVRFVGMAADSLEDLPEIDDEMTFTVTAICTGRGRERMKDGELRTTARMEVRTLTPVSGPKKPATGPTLFSSASDGDGDE